MAAAKPVQPYSYAVGGPHVRVGSCEGLHQRCNEEGRVLWHLAANPTPTTVYRSRSSTVTTSLILPTSMLPGSKGEMRFMLGGNRSCDPFWVMVVTCRIPTRSTAEHSSNCQDSELFATIVNVNLDDSNSSISGVSDQIILSRKYYKGTGQPTFYTTETIIIGSLLLGTAPAVASTRASRIFATSFVSRRSFRWSRWRTCPISSAFLSTRLTTPSVRPPAARRAFSMTSTSTTTSTSTSSETRMWCAHQAEVGSRRYEGCFDCGSRHPDGSDHEQHHLRRDHPSQTGVVYKNGAGTTLTAGAQSALSAGTTLVVNATPASGYYFPTSGTTAGASRARVIN